MKDINHKVSKKIVHEAKKNGMGIKLEYLHGIRNAKTGGLNKLGKEISI